MPNVRDMTNPSLLTSAEAARQLNIDRSTLSRWVADGKVTPALKAPGLRGAYFFDSAEVERLKTKAA